VVVANNGQEAFDAVENGAFDLVLMDIQMPVMDGVEATQRIRERERALSVRHLPIVAMTANAMQGDRERFLAAGMDGYVSKPVKSDELFAEIAAVFGNGAPVLLPPPVAYESHIYKRAEVLERMGGDQELFQTLAGMFVADSASYCSALEQALALADAPTLQREAHTIKGLLATFSEDKGTALAQQLEDCAKRGDLEKADEMTAGLVVAVERLAAALSSELV
jgi:CheY-like chemotaxis protein